MRRKRKAVTRVVVQMQRKRKGVIAALLAGMRRRRKGACHHHFLLQQFEEHMLMEDALISGAGGGGVLPLSRLSPAEARRPLSPHPSRVSPPPHEGSSSSLTLVQMLLHVLQHPCLSAPPSPLLLPASRGVSPPVPAYHRLARLQPLPPQLAVVVVVVTAAVLVPTLRLTWASQLLVGSFAGVLTGARRRRVSPHLLRHSHVTGGVLQCSTEAVLYESTAVPMGVALVQAGAVA